MPGLDEGSIFFTQTLSLSLLSIAVHGKLLLTCGSRNHLQSNSSNPMLKQFLEKKGLEIFYAPSEGQLLSGPTEEVWVPKMNQKRSVPHTLGEPWMPAGECSIHLSVLASMVPNCGDMSFCSVKVFTPAPSIHLGQASKTPPTGCATKLLTAHPTAFHTLSTRQDSQAASGVWLLQGVQDLWLPRSSFLLSIQKSLTLPLYTPLILYLHTM